MVFTRTIETKPGEDAVNAAYRIIGANIVLVFVRPLFNLNPDLHGDRFYIGYKSKKEEM